MPTKLEVKRLNNVKHTKLTLEEQLANLDPNCDEYTKLLVKINKTIVGFTKKLHICVSKKLLNDKEISSYKEFIVLQNIPNRFVANQKLELERIANEKQSKLAIEKQRIEEERIKLEEEKRRIDEERIKLEEELIRSKKAKKIAKLRRRH